MFGRDENREDSKCSKRSKRSGEASSSSQAGNASGRSPGEDQQSRKCGQLTIPRVQEYALESDPSYPGGRRPLHPEFLTEEEREKI